MGFFTLLRQGPGSDAAIARVIEVAHKRGFAQVARRTVADFVLLNAAKMVSPTPQMHEDAAGNFVAATGTCFYRGLYGQMALARLLVDALGDGVDEQELRGAFAIICHVHGRLELFIDALGCYATYRSADDRVWSNSFLAAAAACGQATLSTQGVYEYVFQGAVYGGDTLLEEIKTLSPGTRYRLHPELATIQRPQGWDFSLRPGDLQAQLDAVEPLLQDNFASLVRAFNDNLDTALSGGYDSRLILALLRAQGVTPAVHVYGRADDPDVVVAKAIAAGEGIALKHEDKSQLKPADADAVAAASTEQFWAFDGWPPDGVIGNGSDLATRRARTRHGRLALNGGGGEVLRNFFYLPERSFTAREMVATFYSQYDPRVATTRFNEHAYTAALAAKIAAIFPTPKPRLSRTEVEFIYPGFRGRFWTGRNTTLNTHFGPALTPFFEMNVVRQALRVPLAYKNHGMFEAALIARIDPRLARYPSAYGHDFLDPPPLGRRMKDWFTYLRPPLVRRLSYRLKNRLRPGRLPDDVGPALIARLFPDGVVVMRDFFHLSTLTDGAQMNRLLTVEYLCQALAVKAPD